MHWTSVIYENTEHQWHFVTTTQGVNFLETHMSTVQNAYPVRVETLETVNIQVGNLNANIIESELTKRLFTYPFTYRISNLPNIRAALNESYDIDHYVSIATNDFTWLLPKHMFEEVHSNFKPQNSHHSHHYSPYAYY